MLGLYLSGIAVVALLAFDSWNADFHEGIPWHTGDYVLSTLTALLWPIIVVGLLIEAGRDFYREKFK